MPDYHRTPRTLREAFPPDPRYVVEGPDSNLDSGPQPLYIDDSRPRLSLGLWLAVLVYLVMVAAIITGWWVLS